MDSALDSVMDSVGVLLWILFWILFWILYGFCSGRILRGFCRDLKILEGSCKNSVKILVGFWIGFW